MLNILYIEINHMGITNKAISTKFLNIIITTNHGQTEIVMQYGGLRSSVTCVTTSCSNDSFASPVLCMESINRRIRLVRHQAHVLFPVDFDGDEHVYRVHPINTQFVTDPVMIQAVEEHGCNFGSESLDKDNHVTSCIVILKVVIKVSLLQKGQTDKITKMVSLHFTVFNVL